MTKPQLSKVTTNMASRRGIDLFIDECLDDDANPIDGYELMIFEKEEDMNPIAIYKIEDNGFFFRSALTSSIKEECPYWIEDEQHLRRLLSDFRKVADELTH